MRETFRSALQEAARPAAALGLNIDDPVAVFRRYSSLTRMAQGMLALEANRPQHKRTFGGKLVVITTP
jgi:hypothetical protein